MTEPLQRLSDADVAIWLDDLSRHRLRSGDLARLVRDKHVVGVTTNPTIFHAAVTGGDDYDAQLHELAAIGIGAAEAVRLITAHDVRAACDLLRPIHDATGGRDGRVSIEVDPRLAYDADGTVAEAKLLWWLVDRPNLFIKIPATTEGLPAIRRCIAEGLSVNVTLIFSPHRYRAVMDAYLAGLEDARTAGKDPATIASVASFFVSRVDTEVDQRLAAIGTPDTLTLRGTAAIANARVAYDVHQQVFTSARWEVLVEHGAARQRPLWASTGVKDPAYTDTRYVDQLVAPHTVNTMPEHTLDAVANHGDIAGDVMTGTAPDAEEVFDQLKSVGVDTEDVFATLEAAGVAQFQRAWTDLLATLSDRLGPRRGRRMNPANVMR